LTEVETLRSICALLAVGIVEAASEPLDPGATSQAPEAPEAPQWSAPVTTEQPTVSKPESGESHKELSSDDKRDAAQQSYQEARRLFSGKKYHEAIGALTEAVRLDGTQASYHRLLGETYARNPKWTSSAIEHLERAVELDEFDADAHYLLGKLYEQKARVPEATRAFQHVLSLDPGHAEARRKLDKPSVVTRLRSIFKKTSSR
jgi:tetratricopeptide (TPR) repeat protein